MHEGGTVMNLPTLIIFGIFCVAVVFALRYVRVHGTDDCSGNCGSCHGNCTVNIQKGLQQARIELEKEKMQNCCKR